MLLSPVRGMGREEGCGSRRRLKDQPRKGGVSLLHGRKRKQEKCRDKYLHFLSRKIE